MTTAAEIVNQAIMLIGDNQAPVTGNAPNFDDSTAGKAARYLYAPTVATVQRKWGWDASRNVVALVKTMQASPVGMGAFEYLYPPNGIQVWQIMPVAVADPYNPLPINWTVGNTLVSAVQKKVIWTDEDNARAVYNNNPGPDLWDAGFREAVVSLLANALAMAVAGKPDAADAMLKRFGAFEGIGETRGD